MNEPQTTPPTAQAAGSIVIQFEGWAIGKVMKSAYGEIEMKFHGGAPIDAGSRAMAVIASRTGRRVVAIHNSTRLIARPGDRSACRVGWMQSMVLWLERANDKLTHEAGAKDL